MRGFRQLDLSTFIHGLKLALYSVKKVIYLKSVLREIHKENLTLQFRRTKEETSEESCSSTGTSVLEGGQIFCSWHAQQGLVREKKILQ